MDTIILHFTEKYIKNLKNFLENDDKAFSFFDILSFVSIIINELAIVTIKVILESLDRSIKSDSSRKNHFYVVTSLSKTILTSFGSLSFSRTYYKDKHTNEHKFLLDELIGISDHQEVAPDVAFSAINEAIDSSYRKAGSLCTFSDDILSKQTTRNYLVHTKVPSSVDYFDSTPYSIPYIYIEADEEHVSMQDGSNEIVKLVYLHEGKQTDPLDISKKRLINPVYFHGYLKSNDELWEEVLSFIEKKYVFDDIKNIYIMGDGANWIKAGTSWIPNSEFVLDRFHLMKAARSICNILELDTSKAFISSINTKDTVAFSLLHKQILSSLHSLDIDLTRKRSISDKLNYIHRHWEHIKQKLDLNEMLACSAEGHISHVLSSRLSYRPLGWGKTGLFKMVNLLIYKRNGNNVKDLLEMQHTQDMEKRKTKVTRKIESSLKQSQSRYLDLWNHDIPILSGNSIGSVNAIRGLSNLKLIS